MTENAADKTRVQAAAIVVAGGTGERFGKPGGKQLAVVAGKPVLWWAVNACASAEGVGSVVMVCPQSRRDDYLSAVESAVPGDVTLSVAEAGETRQQSVLSGIRALPDGADPIVIHDGARPVITSGMVSAMLAYLSDRSELQGVVIAHPSIDTVKVVDEDVIVSTPDRSGIWQVQTPQVFRREALLTAHERALDERFEGTDDSSLVERAGGRVGVYCGPRDNIKVTLTEDLAFVEAALSRERGDGA